MKKGKEKVPLLQELPESAAGPTPNTGFQLRIHIIEARDLKGRDSSGQSDPICVVTAFDKEGKTAMHKKTTICVWDHLFIWEFPKMQNKEFMAGRIYVDVYDANTIMRNEMIGRYELETKFVYGCEGHEVFKRWVALADPTDKFEGVQGYLKLSVTALASGDVPVAHTEEEEEEEGKEGDLQSMVLLPPSIKVEEHLLNVRVFTAEGLPKLDTFGSCDPFLQVKFAGLSIKTDKREKTQNPTFNEHLQIPVSLPVMSDDIQVSVWDWDAVGKNEIIATAFISFTAVQQGKFSAPQWVNLYGSPYPEEKRKIVEMNAGFIDATAYRGRVLVSLDTQPTKDAKLNKQPTSPPSSGPPTREYTAYLDLFEGARLDADDASIEAELVVGPSVVSSKKAKIGKEGKTVWYENLQEIRLPLPADLSQCPDLFINIYRHVPLIEKKRIGLLRIKPQDAYAKSKDPPTWDLLQRDILVDSGPFSGFLLYRLTFAPSNEAAAIPRWPVQHPPVKAYHFRAYIYQARNLYSADSNGLSDPYVVVHVAGKVAKTKIIKETVFPQWYETLALDVELVEPLDLAPSISILVFDHDKFSADDLLGLVHVPITSVNASSPVPKWYPLFSSSENFGKAERGELLAAFQLLMPDQAGIPLPNITPPTKDATLGVGIVGLRNLIPYALQPIQNPFVEVRCGKDASARTKPSKQPSGSNPNFLEDIELPVKFPVEPIFSPAVEIKVFDNRVIYKPLIGTATINIDTLLPWANQKKEIEDIPDNAEVVAPPAPEVLPEGANKEGVTEIPQGGEASASEKKSDAIIEINEGGEASASEKPNQAIIEVNESEADNSKGKGKQVGEESILKLDEKAAPAQVEVEVLIESPRPPPEEKEESKIRIPLLSGTKVKDVEINLPNMALRTLPTVADNIPLGLEVLEKEREKEEQESGNVPRTHVQKELERYFKSSISSWVLHKGKQAGMGRFDKKSTYTETGVLKGQVRVSEGVSGQAISLRELYQPLPYVLRAYVLRGINLMPKDRNGLCDPYIVVNTNGPQGKKQVVKDMEVMKKETLNPNFYKCYEIQATLPGDSELEIEIWDWDKVGKDELVGKTTIDLENRQFSEAWRALQVKPIEVRTLWHPLSSNAQGQLEMWLDIMTPAEAAKNPKIEISPPAPRNFELRMIIWNTKDVAFRDAKMSDIFVVGYIEGLEPQKTDIHWRSENGEGMFNWRMVFPLTLPYKNARLKIQLWDKDLLNPNDVIAEASLNLGSFFKKAFKDHDRHVHSIDKQFITLTHPNYEGPQGRCEISVDLYTEEEARKYPVGLGRSDPNQHPFLPKPDRPETSFNPLNPASWISKVLWKQHKGKFICCCVILVIILLIPLLVVFMQAASVFT